MSPFYLPKYEECQEIVQENECFSEKITIIDDYTVSVFNYRLTEYKDFLTPVAGKSLSAFELRGLTFVHTEQGPIRFLMLHKFFNLNQVEGYQLHDVKDLTITRIQTKADGSMIRFIRLPNGKILAKTKNDFSNRQTEFAQAIFNNNKKFQSFVEETLNQGLAAIFELISPMNQIVVSYSKTELSLIQLREEITGNYVDIYQNELVKKYGIKTVVKEESILDWNHYVNLALTLEETEGWIFTLSNGQMIKVKTKWYCDRHGLLTSDLVRESKIVELILTEQIDDALAMINENDPRREYATKIRDVLLGYLSKREKDVFKLVSLYRGNKQKYHKLYSSESCFAVAYELIVNIESYYKEEILKDERLSPIVSYLFQENIFVDGFNDFISFMNMQSEKRPLVRQLRNVAWNYLGNLVFGYVSSLTSGNEEESIHSVMKERVYDLIKEETLRKTSRLMEAKSFLIENGLTVEVINLGDEES